MSATGFNIDDGESSGRPTEEIDLYDRATAQTVDDDILQETNVGLGNYTKKEYWMQVESYRKWAFTHSAIARPLNRRVVDYALTRKAIDAWQSKDESQRESEWESNLRPNEEMEMDRRRWIEAKKADIWDIQIDENVGGFEDRQEVKQERRREIVENYGRGDIHWQPPFGRLLKMRHEASRSIGSRLLDNLFDRVSVQKVDDAAEQAAMRLRDRIGGSNQEDEREL